MNRKFRQNLIAAMAYQHLADFIHALEKEGELIRIKHFVDPVLEMAEIVDRISKSDRNKAILFENTGKNFPVLINSMGSYRRICLALGVENLNDISDKIDVLFKDLSSPKAGMLEKMKMLPKLGEISSWMPVMSNKRGACQEVIMDKPDITQLPVMKCWPEDGGHFITLPVVNTVDPENGIRNVGMYRMQVFGPTLTGMHWHKHKVSASHYNMYKRRGEKMPVTVVLGGDPSYTYAATAPLPPNVDEYLLAGFLRRKKVELVKCITNDLYVPNDADFVIEGYVDPEEELIWEGPFGDHTGYYSLADYYPRFHITCITHKKNAIYPSTIVGIPPQEDAWIGKATERIFLAPIKMTLLPEILDMNLPVEGVFHNITIVKIKKSFAGHAQKVMNAMWGAGQMMFNKILIVVDELVDAQDYQAVAKALSQHVDPVQDILFSNGPMDVLDHSSSKFAFGGKMCIDATSKMEEELRGSASESGSDEKMDDGSIEKLEGLLKSDFREIKTVYAGLAKFGIRALIIGIAKERPCHVQELFQVISKLKELGFFKFILFVEDKVEASDLSDAVWRFANNIDPKRDHFLYDDKSSHRSMIGLDGTRKSRALDGFERDWPNIIASTEATIASVDEKWKSLNIGEFIKSPSLKYSQQLYAGNATVKE